MNKKIFCLTVVMFVAVLFGGGRQAKAKHETVHKIMPKVKEAGGLGTEHAALQAFVGKWKVEGRFWMKPNEEPHASSGTSSIQWVLDGRILQERFKGNWFDEAVEGLGFIGYDKMKKKYVSIWMDSLSTGILQASGRYDAAAKILKQQGRFSYPVTGNSDQPFREEWKIVDANTHLYVMYVKHEGKEFKSMELTYKRK